MAIVEVHPVPIDGPWSATAGQEAGSPPEHVSPDAGSIGQRVEAFAAETLSCSTATIQKLRAERRTLHST